MPRLIVQDAPAPVGQRPASPDSFGAGAGRAMQQTGQVAQALGEVMNQYAESQGRAQAIRYEQELEAEANRISLDPDIAGRGAKFEQAQRRLADRFRPKIGGRATFDQRSDFATRAIRSGFDHRTATDGIRESRLNTDLEVTASMMRMARAESTEDVGAAMLEAREALQSSSLFYTPAEQTRKIQDAYGAGIRAMADTNPVLALKVIDDFGPMLGPEVTAVYREEAIGNIRQRVAIENAERVESERLAKQAAKAASDQAEDELFDLQVSGGLTLGAVAEAKDRLSPVAQRRWYDRAKGKGGDGAADPDVFMSLTDRADAGEDIKKDATEAAAAGLITAVQRNALVKTSRDARFKPGRVEISRTLDPGILTSDMDMRAKRANAITAYDEWVKDNPTATYDEAMGKARELIRVGVARAVGGASLKTVDDVVAEMEKLDAQRALLPPDVYTQKIKRLNERRKEIEALDAIEAAGGAR